MSEDFFSDICKRLEQEQGKLLLGLERAFHEPAMIDIEGWGPCTVISEAWDNKLKVRGFAIQHVQYKTCCMLYHDDVTKVDALEVYGIDYRQEVQARLTFNAEDIRWYLQQ